MSGLNQPMSRQNSLDTGWRLSVGGPTISARSSVISPAVKSVAALDSTGNADAMGSRLRSSLIDHGNQSDNPSPLAPCTWKLFFARSIAMMITSSIGCLLPQMVRPLKVAITQHHLGTLRCRREGASTPSVTRNLSVDARQLGPWISLVLVYLTKCGAGG